MRGDLGKAMDTFKNWTYKNYNGVLIEKTSNGFKVANREYPDYESVIKAIDERRKQFQDLIKRQNPQL